MNKQWLTERIVYHMEVAKEELACRRRVKADDEFAQTAILILPDGKEQELALAFYDYCEQKTCMSELSTACLELDASALIIRARALLLNTDRIKKELDVDGCDRTARRAALVPCSPALAWCNTTIEVVTKRSSSAGRRSAWGLNFLSSANGGSELSC